MPASLLSLTSDENLVLVGGCLLFAVIAFHALPPLLLMPRRLLKDVAAGCPDPESWPRVSFIVAARDEAASVEAALTGLLQLDYPEFEIVFVNDRSTDETGVIADRLAETNERLRVIHVSQLPDGWLGKVHAMHLGAAAAKGDYLLFTDGDVIHAPDSLRQVMRFVCSRSLDHFCLAPSMKSDSLAERTLVSFFAMLFVMGTYPWLRATGFRMAYYGIGAFNLVRRSTYESVGGHELLKLDVLDDVKLGKLLFHPGASAELLVAGEATQVRWQSSAWQVIRGLEKNAFASCRYSVLRLAGFSAFFLLVFAVPYIALAFFPAWPSCGFVAAILLLHLTFGWLSTLFGGSWSVLPLLPAAALAMLFAFWRSAFVTLRNQGVNWRETFYPLPALKQGLWEPGYDRRR